jgi:hypothetical protein
MEAKTVEEITAIALSLVVFIHVIRAIMGIPVSIGSVEIPIWASIAAAGAVGYLAYLNWNAYKHE